jgi:hypothetical protein
MYGRDWVMLHKCLLQLNGKTIGTLGTQEVSEYIYAPVLAFKEELKAPSEVRSVVLVFELEKIHGKNLVYKFIGVKVGEKNVS